MGREGVLQQSVTSRLYVIIFGAGERQGVVLRRAAVLSGRAASAGVAVVRGCAVVGGGGAAAPPRGRWWRERRTLRAACHRAALVTPVACTAPGLGGLLGQSCRGVAVVAGPDSINDQRPPSRAGRNMTLDTVQIAPSAPRRSPV
jgi:hypothetical protein